MALIKHKYSDNVADLLWKAKGDKTGNARSLVVSVVRAGDGDYAVRAIEEGALRRDLGEVVLADNRTLQVFFKKFDTYTKEQSTQFLYHAVNTLLDRQLAVRKQA